MSISGILSSLSQSPLSGASADYHKQIQQLSQDLTSGNLSAAQSDFATLQRAFSQSGTISGSTSGTTGSVHQAFNQFASDLQSGNLPAAQKDFSTAQQALQSLSSAANHLHHQHRLSGGGRGGSGEQNSLLQVLSQVGQGLTSGNLSHAQQAYASLQQPLQQYAPGGGALSAQSTVSLDA